jgi:hypothetical protein
VALDGVWLATGREIAACYTEHYYDVVPYDFFLKRLAIGTRAMDGPVIPDYFAYLKSPATPA